MSEAQLPLHLRQMERQAAEYYARLRTPEATWQSIEDVQPQLLEFEHRLRAGDYRLAEQILEEIDVHYLAQWGYSRRALEMREKLLGHLVDPKTNWYNLNRLGKLAHSLAQYEKALEYHHQALEALQQLDSPRLRGIQLGDIGKTYYALGKYQVAAEHYDRALKLAKQKKNPMGEAFQLVNLARLSLDLVDYEEAFHLYDQALIVIARLYKSTKNEHTFNSIDYIRGGIFQSLGEAYLSTGEYAEADRNFRLAVSVGDTNPGSRSQSIYNNSMARLALDTGDYDKALEYSEAALAVDIEIGSVSGEIHSLSTLAEVYHAKGQFATAISLCEKALKLARNAGSRWHIQRRSVALAELHLLTGNLPEALTAVEDARSYDVPANNHYATLLHGIIAARLQEQALASDLFQQAVVEANTLLDATANFFQAHYTRILAMCGMMLLTPLNEQKAQLEAILPAETEDAMETCHARGVVENTLQLMTSLQPLDPADTLSKVRILFERAI